MAIFMSTRAFGIFYRLNFFPLLTIFGEAYNNDFDKYTGIVNNKYFL